MLHARQDYNRIQDPAALIPANEPVFLLRGQDVLAAPTVRYYADLCRRSGTTPEQTGSLAGIAETADAHADLMDMWQTSKLPDLKAPGVQPMLDWKAGQPTTVAGREVCRVTSHLADEVIHMVTFEGPTAGTMAGQFAHFQNSGAMLVYLASIGK